MLPAMLVPPDHRAIWGEAPEPVMVPVVRAVHDITPAVVLVSAYPETPGAAVGRAMAEAVRAAAVMAGCVAAAARLRAETAKLRTTARTTVRTTVAREVAAPPQCTAFSNE